MDQNSIDAELFDLRRKLSKRENTAGFAKNVEAIKARIAELEAMTPEEATP